MAQSREGLNQWERTIITDTTFALSASVTTNVTSERTRPDGNFLSEATTMTKATQLLQVGKIGKTFGADCDMGGSSMNTVKSGHMTSSLRRSRRLKANRIIM